MDWNEWWAIWQQKAGGLVLSEEARKAMERLGHRYASAGFPNPYQWSIDASDLDGTLDELLSLGFLSRSGPALHLADPGRSWIFDVLGLVVAFCPKCSTDEMMPRGQREAHASCRVCGVGWTEDTTADPFVTKY